MSISQFLRRHWMTIGLICGMFCFVGVTVVRQNAQGSAGQSLPNEGQAYNFTLESSTGNRTTLNDFAGKVRLVAFIYTRCNASCPVVTSQMVHLQNNLKRDGLFGNKVEFISITMDPTFDKGPVLRKYEKQYEVASVGWKFLTGTQQAIGETLKHYGIFANKIDASQYVHTIAEFLIDGNGNIRKVYGMDISAQGAEKDIQSLVHAE